MEPFLIIVSILLFFVCILIFVHRNSSTSNQTPILNEPTRIRSYIKEQYNKVFK